MEFFQSFILVATMGVAFLFSRSFLSQYDIQVASFLFLILYFKKHLAIFKKSPSKLIESAIFSFIIVIIVQTSGGLSSPFFFLNYFLIFSFSLLLSPTTSLTAALSLVILLIISHQGNLNFKDYLPTLSLLLMTPFALYLAEERQAKIIDQKEKEKNQETNFLFLSLVVKNHLRVIKEAVDNFVDDEQLAIIRKHLNRLEKLIDKFIVSFLIIFFLANLSPPVKAVPVKMDSANYRINEGNLNIGARNQSSSNYNLATTIGQLAANKFQSSGYIVKAGFQYIHSIIPFSFAISSMRIDFGEINADTPQTDSVDLTVSFGGAGEYQVTAIENGPLRKLSNESIPDTSCNGGDDTCTRTLAKAWTINSAYGFGYNMNGDDIPSDFTDTTYYRPFADKNQSQDPVVIMSNTNVGKNRQATVTFKVNVSSIQAAGSYQTVVNFTATPSY